MSYASQADMEERFGATELAQRTDRISGETIDATVLARALADADAEIDGYLATRYTLPLPSTPPAINRLACEIARYRLFDDGVPETVRVRYQDAVSLLKRLSSGEVQLAGISPVVVAGGTGNAVATRTAPKQFDGISLGVY
jgi:phage gp36-like protein